MKLNAQELIEIMRSNIEKTGEMGDLRERVLKLEHKTNELMDMLTDFRVNQIMSGKDDENSKL